MSCRRSRGAPSSSKNPSIGITNCGSPCLEETLYPKGYVIFLSLKQAERGVSLDRRALTEAAPPSEADLGML